MKLIIDISEEEMKYPANIIQAVKHGIPLDKVRAEIEHMIPCSKEALSMKLGVLEIIDKYKAEGSEEE